MVNIIKQINDELKKKFIEMNFDEKYACISISNRPELCDYQINSCFNIAKEIKKNPMDVANSIAGGIKDVKINGIAAFNEVSVAAPAFINLVLNDELLCENACEILKGGILSVVDENDKELLKIDDIYINQILLDYGGANVAKPLHVGHLRVAVIGEALKRLYNRLNIKTIADVHLGDYGLQMGLVIEELKDENKLDNFTIDDLEIIYPKASLRAKGQKEEKDKDGNVVKQEILPDVEFNERAHLATKKLQDNIEPELTIWKKILEISIEDLKKRYRELNVFFDYYYGESTVKDIMGPMVDEFIKRGIAYSSEGAYVIDVKEDSDKKEMPPCIVRKTDGAALYATSDIATIKFREEHFDADEYVYIVDKRQSLHLEQCFRASVKAGLLTRKKVFKHVGVGTMNGKDGKPFKSRDGGVVKLWTLINEAKEKALAELDKNERNLEGLDVDDVAKKIAIAALKYGDLMNQPTRDYVFDMDKFLSFQGNTGPYILYTVVRIKSIFEKMGTNDSVLVNDKNDSVVVKDNVDKIIHNILRTVPKYKDTLISAYKNYDPSIICKFIYELSNDFNTFYHEHNIINENDVDKKNLYIMICKIVEIILRDALDILAIEVPDKM